METKEFIEKLKAINLNENKNGELINGKWEVKYHFRENVNISTDMPSSQLIVNVLYDGANAMQWGCVSEDSQKEILTMFLTIKVKSQSKRYQQEEDARKIAKLMFKDLY